MGSKGVLALAASVVFGAASMAGASVVVFTQYDIWAAFSDDMGNPFIASEDFAGYDGFIPSGETGDIGGISWTATAEGGLFADAGLTYFSTALPSTELVINFGTGVMGVGGNFFGTFADFSVAPSIVEVSLNDGTTYFASISAADQFVGFYSLGAAIIGIAVDVDGSLLGEPPVYATVDNLYIAIPSPASMALLGVAGLVARRRRR